MRMIDDDLTAFVRFDAFVVFVVVCESVFYRYQWEFYGGNLGNSATKPFRSSEDSCCKNPDHYAAFKQMKTGRIPASLSWANSRPCIRIPRLPALLNLHTETIITYENDIFTCKDFAAFGSTSEILRTRKKQRQECTQRPPLKSEAIHSGGVKIWIVLESQAPERCSLFVPNSDRMLALRRSPSWLRRTVSL